MRRKAVAWAAASGAICLVTVAAFLVGPMSPSLDGRVTGDAEIAESARTAAGDPSGFEDLSVAVFDGGQVRAARFGACEQFEIGSIGKALAGMLLADLAESGELNVDATLASTLPGHTFTDPETASITLGELASHRSGLPRLGPLTADLVLRGWLANLNGGNPYAGAGRDEVLQTAATVDTASGPHPVRYSNFGFAVLGNALAPSYPDALRTRVLAPIGMGDTVIGPASPPCPGHTATGLRADPWVAPGAIAAGMGIWSTAPDLAKLAVATMSGSAPGADAATPRWDAGPDQRIGYGWFTSRYGDREITWHNGGTGGFRSFVGFDRASGRAVAVLGNTTRSVDGIGLRLLGIAPPPSDDDRGPAEIAITLVLLVFAAGGVLLLRVGKLDRIRLVNVALTTAAFLAMAHRIGAWLAVPSFMWTLTFGLCAVGLALFALRWQDLSVIASGRPWVRWTGLGLTVAVVAALAILLAG